MSSRTTTLSMWSARSWEWRAFWERLSFGLFVIALAWAPFPLGSNRPWSWSLLTLLIAAAWLVWSFSVWRDPGVFGRLAKGLLGPIALSLAAIVWGFVEILPILPTAWLHPAWRLAAEITGQDIAATLSVSSWTSATELMKLLSYLAAAWLARAYGRDAKRGGHLLTVVIVTGAAYAAYGFVLASSGYSQFELFYGMPLQQVARDFPGPFVNHNSFATYEGLIALCAGARLISEGWARHEVQEGVLPRLMEMARYFSSRGAFWLVAAILALSVVVSTGSRGGNLATWSAVMALLFMALAVASRQKRGLAALAIALPLGLAVAGLLVMSGTSLAGRLNDMANTGSTDATRLVLWHAALVMIRHAPLAGWGLGTYQLIYPLFSTATMPFIMDKAHNDYLELAAGWGLPAALLWWAALVWLAAICLRGFFVRRRDRLFPALGVGASILVGVHSLFDFSLQIPAVALTYAAVLGIAAAQAFPTGGGRR